jgi:capsule polysaccharide export protein KpsE/RkpR
MSLNEKNSSLLLIVKQNLKLITVVTLLALCASIIFSSSLFIAPKYKSEVSLYPSNLINYSSESATEQLLQLLRGNDIRNNIVHQFNLMQHYDIDSTSKGSLFYLKQEFNNNVRISKTNFESVNIEVLDTDPILAKKIAEELIIQVNLKIRNLHKLKAKEVVVIRKNEVNNKQLLIDSLEAKIQYYSTQYGLLDYTQQSREVTSGYMEMLLKGKKNKEVETLYNNLTKEGGHFQDLHQQLDLAREDYNKILIQYESAVVDSKKELTYTNTVVSPEIADKKSYPIRWLIVLLSVFGSLVFTMVLLMGYNRLKQF